MLTNETLPTGTTSNNLNDTAEALIFEKKKAKLAALLPLLGKKQPLGPPGIPGQPSVPIPPVISCPSCSYTVVEGGDAMEHCKLESHFLWQMLNVVVRNSSICCRSTVW